MNTEDKNIKYIKIRKAILLKKSTVLSFLSLFIYKIVLDFSYYFIIHPIWNYMGFVLNINILKIVESYMMLFIVFILIPKSYNKISNIAIWLLLLMSYVPMLSLFGMANEPRLYMYSVTLFWILIFLFYRTIFKISLRSIKKAQSIIILWAIFIIFIIIDFVLIYRYLGFSLHFNLKQVYNIRAKYVSKNISFSDYLFNWSAYIVDPVFFAIFWIKRKWIFVTLIVVLQLLLFSGTGMKSYLFAIPFVLLLMWVVKCKYPFSLVSISFAGGVIFGMFSYLLINDRWITSLFTRRTLFVPAELSFYYYDFFSKHGFLFLSSQRIFREFFKYPYKLSPPHLIAAVYFNNPLMSANNGIISDAYMNFGFVGLVLWAVIVVIILKLIDNFSSGKSSIITIAAVAMPVMFLSNSTLSTSLLTHGLFISLILLYLLPRGIENKYG